MTDNWTARWPTEPGYYWFYGWLTPRGNTDMYFVAATANGGMRYTVLNYGAQDTHRVYAAGGAEGLWHVADMHPPTQERWGRFLTGGR